MSESEMTDILLEFYALRQGTFPVEANTQMRPIHTNVINKMTAYKLIETRGKPGIYFLTELGYQAYNAGGFEKWIQGNQRKADELHQATIDTSNATIDAAKSAKNSKYAAWVASIAAVVALLYPMFSSQKKQPAIPTQQSVP